MSGPLEELEDWDIAPLRRPHRPLEGEWDEPLAEAIGIDLAHHELLVEADRAAAQRKADRRSQPWARLLEDGAWET